MDRSLDAQLAIGAAEPTEAAYKAADLDGIRTDQTDAVCTTLIGCSEI